MTFSASNNIVGSATEGTVIYHNHHQMLGLVGVGQRAFFGLIGSVMCVTIPLVLVMNDDFLFVYCVQGTILQLTQTSII